MEKAHRGRRRGRHQPGRGRLRGAHRRRRTCTRWPPAWRRRACKLGEQKWSYLPQNTVKLEGENAKKMLKLMELLEENDDVQNVHANFEIDEALMELALQRLDRAARVLYVWVRCRRATCASSASIPAAASWAMAWWRSGAAGSCTWPTGSSRWTRTPRCTQRLDGAARRAADGAERSSPRRWRWRASSPSATRAVRWCWGTRAAWRCWRRPRRGCRVHEYPPARVKRSVGAGGADGKDAVARMVCTFLAGRR